MRWALLSLFADPLPAYVRVLTGAPSKWFADPPDLEALARVAFDLEDTAHSVYRVWSSAQEALAVAAHSLTFKRSNIQPAWSLRIHRTDLESLDCGVEQVPGETGVLFADTLHRDLRLPNNGPQEVVKRILGALRDGEDRIRKVDDLPIRHLMSGFMSEPTTSQEATQACKKALKIQ